MREHAVYIAQVDRQAVELQVDRVFHIVIDTQPVAHATVEGSDIRVFKAVVQRQHRHRMLYLFELRQRRSAYPQSRRIGAHQLWVLLLQRLQFPEQQVILGIRDAGIIQHIIGMRVTVQFFAQLCRPGRRILRIRRGFAQYFVLHY